MKHLFFSLMCIFCCVLRLYALEWPTDTVSFFRLFGQRIEGNSLEQGLTFENSGMVRAAEHGMLLIALDQNRRCGSFPSTLGNALIFLHDDGLQTIYGNLENNFLFRGRITAEKGNIIGKAGNSGWGNQGGLIFQVSDNQRQVYINPLLLLPAVDDRHAPQIQNVFLVNERNKVIQAAGQKTVKQGSYELYAEIFDTANAGGRTFSPFRITIFLNGINIRTIPFETINQKDGAVFLGNTALTDVLLYRRSNTLYLGKIVLNRGKSDILLTARDITGNEKSELFSVQVE